MAARRDYLKPWRSLAPKAKTLPHTGLRDELAKSTGRVSGLRISPLRDPIEIDLVPGCFATRRSSPSFGGVRLSFLFRSGGDWGPKGPSPRPVFGTLSS